MAPERLKEEFGDRLPSGATLIHSVSYPPDVRWNVRRQPDLSISDDGPRRKSQDVRDKRSGLFIQFS